MTVGELLEVFHYCVMVDITIRDNGRWVQGYKIGENITIGRSYLGNEEPSIMKKGEVRDVTSHNNRLPLLFMNKPVSKMPKNLLDLKVQDVIPRRAWQCGYSSEKIEHCLDITCYPEGYIPVPVMTEDDELEGQMKITDYL